MSKENKIKKAEGGEMIKVKTYNMQTASGKHIRQATKVTIDGVEICFTEKLSKKAAIKNALYQVNK